MENETTSLCSRKVDFKVFIWAISIIGIVIGWILVSQSQVNCKVDEYQKDILEVKTQLSQIQTDLFWIKQHIENNQ